MHPQLFKINGFQVSTYGFAMVTAFITCFVLAYRERRMYLPKTRDIYNLCLLAIASLLFGNKLIHMIISGNFSQSALSHLLEFWQPRGFSFGSSFLSALILLTLYCLIRGIPLLPVTDHLLPIAILGVAIQRCCGCFLAGCCYGKPTGSSIGIIFPNSCPAGNHFTGIPIHPVQLYYGLSAIAIFIFLNCYKSHVQRIGTITAWSLALLAISYFAFSNIRGDLFPLPH
jgi:phosphatidylglycerol:prolipoprotein diacylglycerol transferase